MQALKLISLFTKLTWDNTNTLTWELIGTVTWVNTNTLKWELIGTEVRGLTTLTLGTHRYRYMG